MLRKKAQVDASMGETPRRQNQKGKVRKALFPKQKPMAGMLIWSWDKDWKNKMAKSQLPISVTIGLKIPWDKTKNCKICTTETSGLRGMIQHLQRAHKPRKMVYVCGRCAGTYSTLAQASSHYPKCGAPRKKKFTGGEYKCDFCPNTFSTKSGMTNHIRCKHSVAYLTEPQRSGKMAVSGRATWKSGEVEYLRDLMASKGSAKKCLSRSGTTPGGKVLKGASSDEMQNAPS